MVKVIEPAPPELVARWRAAEDQPLDATAFAARVAAPLTDREREDIRGLLAWFGRRYPTAVERLAYHRRRELAARRRPR